MRLSRLFIPLAAFALAAIGAGFAADRIVEVVEDTSVASVRDGLARAGHDWATVQGDGLQLVLEGEAPTEAQRFRAMTEAGRVVDASRVIDNMSVQASARIEPPSFAIEILRNDDGISLIGLIPAGVDREALADEIGRLADGQPVTDFLEVADYEMPVTWRASQGFALEALERLPRSKISVSAGRVAITAISDSAQQKRLLETQINRDVPDGVDLSLTITAPRPVVTPYTVRYHIEDGGAWFDACVADSAEARDRILAAAEAAGTRTDAICPEGLGAPSARWGEAVALGIEALAEIGGGTISFSDAEVVLVAAAGSPPGTFETVVGELTNALPPVFALDAILPEAPSETAEGPVTFTATLSPEGQVQLRGRVADDLMNETLANFASARFGQEVVTMGTRPGEGLPPGWSVRMLAAVDALAKLSNGAVVVTPDMITVRGKTGSEGAQSEISRLLIDRIGQTAEFEVDVEYIRALDPIAGLPTPEECVEQILGLTEQRKIIFDPGSATLTAASEALVDDIAETLRRCAELRLEIAGYTDSQGRDSMNLALSQDRANAVLSALRDRRVPVGSFDAVGYGEADPIADNGTEDGREANRRIEFRLIVPEPIEERVTALEELEAEMPEAPAEDDATESGEADEAGEGEADSE